MQWSLLRRSSLSVWREFSFQRLLASSGSDELFIMEHVEPGLLVQEWTCRRYRIHYKFILEPSFCMLHDKEIDCMSWQYIQWTAVLCQSLIMGGGTVSETMECHSTLTWLVTWKYIIRFTWLSSLYHCLLEYMKYALFPHHVGDVVCNELCIMYFNIFTTVQIKMWTYPLC